MQEGNTMNNSIALARRAVIFMLASFVLITGASYTDGTRRTSAHIQNVSAHKVEKEPRQHGTPIENLLNTDGTLNLEAGFTGSLDPAGWEMVDGPGGEPRFVRSGPDSEKTSRQTADAPGDENWDSRFGLPGVSGSVYVITVAASSIYVGGTFTTAGDIPANYIARWDGTRWHNLGTGMYDDVDGGSVSAIAVNGTDVYVGGDFIRAGDVPANGIARWDGAQWHALGSGVLRSPGDNGHVADIKIIGSDAYVGGNFTTAGDVTANGIARWDGSRWFPLGTGLAYDTNVGIATDMAVVGSILYVGGIFNLAGGMPANRVARWDGSQWHALGEGPNNGIPGGSVYALAANSNFLFVGGIFSTAGSTPARNIARWDGTQWSSLGTGTNPGVDNIVRAIAVNGNDVYVGGHFSTANGVAAERIARWDGTQWHALGNGVSSAGFALVYAITPDGGDVYVGGDFTIAGQVSASRIAKWSGAGWTPIGSGPGNGVHWHVHAIALRDDEVYVGGVFTRTGGIDVGSIAMWNGAQWSPLGSGVRGAQQSRATVNAIVISGNDIYVGGSFTMAGDVAASNIAKWDGSRWSSLGSGMDRSVRALALSGGYLYAGGVFTMAGGVPARGIARWDGAQWSTLGDGINNGVDGQVYAIAVGGGNVYVGGQFTTAGGISTANIARWDGSSWSALGSGTDDTVYALAAEGENLYAGGSFTTAGGITANRIAKWTGSQLEPLGSGVSDCLVNNPSCSESVNALAIGAGGLYAGGRFLKAGGVEVNYIARWDGSQWWPLGSGVANGTRDALVYAIAINSTGTEVYVGGAFTAAGGKSSNALGLWHTTCRGSFSDVPLDSTFYTYVRCLVCRGIVSGYSDGTFRPNNLVTRGQLAKIVSNAAGFAESPDPQIFEDVAPDNTFYQWINRLTRRGYMSGYVCGAPGEPCTTGRPYFRPFANATRGQTSKIVSNTAGYSELPTEQTFEDVPPTNTFYREIQRLASRNIMGGYPCGGPGEPCMTGRPYFRPTNDVTRGQSAKIVANTFFPGCQTP